MKTLFLDCSMGAAGDMLTAALVDLFEDKKKVVDRLNSIGIPKVTFFLESAEKCGIKGSAITVDVGGEREGEDHDCAHHAHHDHHEHHHASLADIKDIVFSLDLSDKIKEKVFSIYEAIAEAESKAHGAPLCEVHFHEVGAMDAVADVTAVCALIDMLSVERIVVSPVRTGYGSVRCAHGILPVPAPATANLLKGVPAYAGDIEGELLTPTGAAILIRFADEFSEMPLMKTQAIGIGFGKKDFPKANCVRAFLGETEEGGKERIKEVSFNVDDMTAEELAFATEKIFAAGAKEVFSTPAYMKKGRLGTLVTVLCDEGDLGAVINCVYKHTSTIGLRVSTSLRYILSRSEKTVDTPFGKVGIKTSEGYGAKKVKAEYEDVCRIANENDMTFREAKAFIENGKS